MTMSTSSKKYIHEGLTFFTNKISSVNMQRLRYNRNKNLVNYITMIRKTPSNLKSISTAVGIMSFSLYYLQLIATIANLIEIKSKNNHTQQKKSDITHKLYLDLVNSLLWSTCNLTQFVLANSSQTNAGALVVQLEIIGQSLDLLIMLINYNHIRQEQERKLSKAAINEKELLELEWEYRKINYLRSLLHLGSALTALCGLAVFKGFFPSSPLIFLISLLSNTLKVALSWSEDTKRLQIMQKENYHPSYIQIDWRNIKLKRIKDVCNLLCQYALAPVSLLLLAAAPIPLTIICFVAIVAIEHIIGKYLDSLQHNHEPEKVQLTRPLQEEKRHNTLIT